MQHRAMANLPAIPRYFLYGEPPAEVELDFLHVEPIHVRSGAHDWRIAPHAHPEHCQILLVAQGGGQIRIEGRHHAIAAPALIVIPQGLVHAIEFSSDTDGVVATIARPYLQRVIGPEPELFAAIERPRCQCLDADWPGLGATLEAFEALAQEFVWQGPGRRAAIASHLLRILVVLLRLHRADGAEDDAEAALPPVARRRRELVHSYRALIERHFRNGQTMSFYAEALHVPPARLNAACQSEIGTSATRLLFDRQMIEAKRHLLYTDLSVAQIAQALGFEDAAYFTRFFTKRAGLPPSRFRAAAHGEAGSPG